jgi:hypothetical protein
MYLGFPVQFQRILYSFYITTLLVEGKKIAKRHRNSHLKMSTLFTDIQTTKF